MEKWKEENNKLYRKFEFKSFIEAWGFLNKVALLAEKADHHPDWSNSYNKVEITLTTHDENNQVTDKDRGLAAAIDKII